MANVLGLLAFAAYVVLIVGFAAAVTWLVVRMTPRQKKPKPGGPAQS
jgi:hypothetical protein